MLVTSFVFSQNRKTKYEQEIDSIITIHSKSKKLDSLGSVAHEASIHFYRKGDFSKAISYALQEVRIGKKNLSKEKHKRAISNLGLFYYRNNQYFKSIEAYEKVIDSFPVDKRTYATYCNMGRNYNRLGDFYQALIYFEKGLTEPDSLTINSLLGHTINLALVYDNIETQESAKKELVVLKKADSIYLTNNFNKGRFYSLKNTFGAYYKNDLTFNFKKSKSYFLKVLEKSIFEKDSLIQIASYNNLGELHNKVKNDSAFYYLSEGLKISNIKNASQAEFHSNLAEYYSIKNQHKEALIELQKSLKIIAPKGIADNYLTIPKIEEIALSNNKYLALDNLKDKAKNLLKIESRNKQNSTLALKHLQIADELLDIIKAESFETNSKLFWQKKASELYMLAVRSAFNLNKTEDVFYFMEKNKAVLLLENIDKSELKKVANIPIVVLEKEYRYKKEISDLENLINQAQYNSDSIKTKYYSLKIDYKNFIESLKFKYSEYYNYKKPINIPSLNAFQKSIPKNQIVVEYILDDNEGYVLCFTKEKAHLFKLNEIASLQTEIRNYLNLISQPLKTEEDLISYNLKSERLKNLLLPFIHEKEFQNKNKLLIIPDYTLQNVPFESLKNDNRYLIEDFEISYAYSLSFLEKNTAIKRNAKESFIAFAPKTFSYDNLQLLPRSETEARRIHQLLDGEVLLDTSASKANFFSKIKDYKIIHLSTHANANDSIAPWIAFKNKKLYLNELYTIKNQAELVVLNACNSSLGSINAGEGVFSLARGFLYSGSNSVVSSLWNVNDKSNAEITTSFYTYLKDGETKSVALRQAKLDYLKTHSLSETSPYYWSSLILIGDDASVSLGGNSVYYMFLGVFLLLALFFLFKKVKIVGNNS